jgi:hypothetical protein
MALRSVVHKIPALLLLFYFPIDPHNSTPWMVCVKGSDLTLREHGTKRNDKGWRKGRKKEKRAMITKCNNSLCIAYFYFTLVSLTGKRTRRMKGKKTVAMYTTMGYTPFRQQIYSPTDENQVGNSSHSNRKGLDIETSQCNDTIRSISWCHFR